MSFDIVTYYKGEEVEKRQSITSQVLEHGSSGSFSIGFPTDKKIDDFKIESINWKVYSTTDKLDAKSVSPIEFDKLD